MQMTNRCMLAQDQALYWADCEIVFLRWKWDGTLERKQQLEQEKQDLEDWTEEAGGVGGGYNTATTQEETMTAGGDLRAATDIPSTAMTVPERRPGQSGDGLCFRVHSWLLPRPGD
jgi:hypothetical protein